MSFPVDRSDQRSYDDDWSGTVVVCDIDRTYLNTRFSSLGGLARIPIEFAVDKRAIAGMVPLLRELRRGPERTSRSTPLYFLSASPPQMRPVIERKMLMDGVEFDGTTFKDWGGVLRSGRWWRLKEQLGFKLTALLRGRLDLPRGAVEVLFGDDLESDPLAYALYADILAGRVPLDGLPQRLMGLGVGREDAWGIVDLKRMLPDLDGVGRAYIRLEHNGEPAALRGFFPGVVPCRGPFQMAISLWAEGHISDAGVARVARGLAERDIGPAQLGERLSEAARLAFVARDRVAALSASLVDAEVLTAVPELPAADPTWSPTTTGDAARTWTPAELLR